MAEPGRRRLRLAGLLAPVVVLATVAPGCGIEAPSAATPTEGSGHVLGADPAPGPDLGAVARLGSARRHDEADGVVPTAGFEAFTDPGPAPTAPLPLAPEVRAGSPLGAGPRTVYAIGDSVLLSTQATLPASMGGWTVVLDGRVSRRIPEGRTLLEANRSRLTQVVVILLGHNYGGEGSAWAMFDEMLALTAGVERVVLVTVAEWSPAQRLVNDAIRHAATVHPNVVVADWAAVSRANPSYLHADRVHLTRDGAWALAQLIATVTGPLPDLSPGPHPPLPTVPASAPPTSSSTTTTSPASSTTTKAGGSSTSSGGSSTTGPTGSSSTSSSASTTSTEGSTVPSTTQPPGAD